MTSYPLLFQPFEIPPFQLKNRITMAPLFTMCAYKDGRVSDLILAHYDELANGGGAFPAQSRSCLEACPTRSYITPRAAPFGWWTGTDHNKSNVKRKLYEI